jgi:hypothetical protein
MALECVAFFFSSGAAGLWDTRRFCNKLFATFVGGKVKGCSSALTCVSWTCVELQIKGQETKAP